MANLDKLVDQLGSPKADRRYDACEELRVSTESSEAVINALEKVTKDTDPDIAERARAALDAEAHRAMRIELGRLEPPIARSDNAPATQIPNYSLSLYTVVGLVIAVFLILCLVVSILCELSCAHGC